MVIDSDAPPQNPIADFEDFFKTFEDVPQNFKYRRKISEAFSKSDSSIVVLFEDLLNFNPTLANYVKNHPDQALKDAAESFKNILRIDSGGQLDTSKEYFVRIGTQNNSNEVKLRKIRSKHIDRLIYVKGVVIRATGVRPLITIAAFECPACGNVVQEPQMMGKLHPPRQCNNPNCNNNRDFRLNSEHTEFIDHQIITLQETPEELRSGAIPQTLAVILLYDLVDGVRPGERVKVMGILKTNPQDEGPNKVSTLCRTHLYANYIEGNEQTEDITDLTPQDLEEIRSLAQEPDIQKKIARSIARTVMGHEHLKLAAGLSIFGGNQKLKKDGSKIRGDIHVLFMGDPGTGKSQILQNCALIAPRSIYTSGRGASAAGLTAAVVRENDMTGMQLEAGALVLSSGGVACIDEFDKIKNEDRVAIHEAMEQQSYHPQFEISFANKESVRIGHFVDNLFNRFPDKKIQGINCEMLSLNNDDYKIDSTDFQSIIRTKIDRVSRHIAPDHFIKIKYSNGRSILVTPEHPIYIIDNQEISTIDANKITIDTFIPAVPQIKYEGNLEIRIPKDSGRKEINLPTKMDIHLAAFLGYMVTEGYSYLGSSAEIGLSNTDPQIIQNMIHCIETCFKITPINYTEQNRTIRIISKFLFDYLIENFNQVMQYSFEKRVPPHIFQGNIENKRAFLRAAFEGDGGIESTAICFSTYSEMLANDYQDLLLTMNIFTRITQEIYYFGENKEKSRIRYKVYITDDSLEKFVTDIIPNFQNNENIQQFLKKGAETNRKHDIVPPDLGKMIIELYNILKIPYDGYFWEHISNNYGINKDILTKYFEIAINKEEMIRKAINSHNSISEINERMNYSKIFIAQILHISKDQFKKIENNEKNNILDKNLVQSFKEFLLNEINIAKQLIQNIQQFLTFRWLRISDVEIIKNEGIYKTEWVYDVTIEPTHNFISHGIILHNTVSIAKAGIVATLQSKTAIIAAANPKSGRYNEFMTPTENINLSPAILSRFDLIFIVRDKPEPNSDDRIAEYILRSHMEGMNETYTEENDATKNAPKAEDYIPMELLKKYIHYAKKVCHPRITPEVAKKIKEYYVNLRNKGGEDNGAITIVARNLDGIIRMCEAYAKMALLEFVTPEIVDVIIELLNRSLHDIGFDPETGTVDMDRLIVGTSTNKRQKIIILLQKIKELQEANPKVGLKFEDIFGAVSSIDGMTEDFVKEALETCAKEGDLFKPTHNEYKLIMKGKYRKKKGDENSSAHEGENNPPSA